MPESFAVIVDWPPAALSQNGPKWVRYAKSRATKAYRTAAYFAALERGVPASCPWKRAKLSIMFQPPNDRRRRDKLNYVAMMKSAIDGIADTGLVVNDSGVEPGEVRWSNPDPETPECVILHFERMEDAP